MDSRITKIDAALAESGFSDDQRRTVQAAVAANLPPETYNRAVLFLGWCTLVLVLGGVLLAGLGKEVPEALWTALGAGIGGLAGIFMGRN